MRILFRLLSSVICFSMLSGCTAFSQMMQGVSGKQTEKASVTQSPPRCESWCHNGWCSTHCENSQNGEQY